AMSPETDWIRTSLSSKESKQTTKSPSVSLSQAQTAPKKGEGDSGKLAVLTLRGSKRPVGRATLPHMSKWNRINRIKGPMGKKTFSGSLLLVGMRVARRGTGVLILS